MDSELIFARSPKGFVDKYNVQDSYSIRLRAKYKKNPWVISGTRTNHSRRRAATAVACHQFQLVDANPLDLLTSRLEPAWFGFSHLRVQCAEGAPSRLKSGWEFVKFAPTTS